MALLLDSLASLFLFFSTLGVWVLAARARSSARVNIRFAAMLFAALAVARVPGFFLPGFGGVALAVALIAASLGAAALALAFLAILARPLPPLVAALALALALLAGLDAALSGQPVTMLLCQCAIVALTAAAGFGVFSVQPRRAVLSVLSALSLLCGGMALMDGALNLAQAFFAVAMIGTGRASQDFIETRTERQHLAVIERRG